VFPRRFHIGVSPHEHWAPSRTSILPLCRSPHLAMLEAILQVLAIPFGGGRQEAWW
jgi:hypothetical protein